MAYRYVPLLRSKAGEAKALLEVEPSAKDRMFPIISLTSKVPTTFSTKVGQAWTGRRLGLDGLFNFNETGSTAAMQAAAVSMRAEGAVVVPAIAVGAPLAYLSGAVSLATDDVGLIVKARLGDLASVESWLAQGGWQPSSVDLVVMAGHVADVGAGVLNLPTISHLKTLSPPPYWRSITLASSAAPKDYSALATGAAMVPRLDWQLWKDVRTKVPYQLDYGDSGIGHPDMTEPPGFAMANATVSVRYALDDNWLIIKGRPIGGSMGIPMPTQYLGHAKALAGAPQFGGLSHCWGDSRIQQIATAAVKPGSRQSWVEINANRHLSLVAARLP